MSLAKNLAYAVKICSAVLILTGMHTSLSLAASSEWQDLGGGKGRLLAHLDPRTNKISGVVEIKLKEGWSTYWRYPGSSGIPPRFDFSKSIAFTLSGVKFPAPQLITQDYGTYAGYKKKVMFPFEGELHTTGTTEINLDLLIGICSKVCIPATAQFNIQNYQLLQSDLQATQAISFAKVSIPIKKDAGDTLKSIEQINKDTLYITTKHKKSFGKPSLFVEGPSDWYLLPAKLISQEEEFSIFKLDVSRAPKGTDILAQKLRYTIVTGSSGIEIQR